ncbi:Uncharacterised protein [Klebsiella pneumoniae]|nr:Uncharacterised protein [Klebsiella pneumoniae]
MGKQIPHDNRRASRERFKAQNIDHSNLFGGDFATDFGVLFFLALGFLPQIHNQCASIHFFGHATDQHVQLTLVKAEDFNVTKYQRLQLFL